MGAGGGARQGGAGEQELAHNQSEVVTLAQCRGVTIPHSVSQIVEGTGPQT